MKQLALVTRKTMEHFVTKQIFERLDMLKTFQTGKKKEYGWQWLNPSPPSMTFHYLFRDKIFWYISGNVAKKPP